MGKKIYQICNPDDEDEIVFDVPREEVEEDIQIIYVPNEYMHRFIQEFNFWNYDIIRKKISHW